MIEFDGKRDEVSNAQRVKESPFEVCNRTSVTEVSEVFEVSEAFEVSGRSCLQKRLKLRPIWSLSLSNHKQLLTFGDLRKPKEGESYSLR